MIKRVYVDNSVIGGKHDIEFAPSTEKLFREFKLGLYIPVISDLTTREIQGALPAVLEIYDELREIAELVDLNDEAVRLSEAYLKDGKFSKRMLADTLHIATATVHRVDIVVPFLKTNIIFLSH
jgi:hypothetical protein